MSDARSKDQNSASAHREGSEVNPPTGSLAEQATILTPDGSAANDALSGSLVAQLSTGNASPRQLGQYELLDRLGQGGMGVVYRARHIKLDKLVAIKLLPSDFMRTEQSVARFEREMKAVGKISHPNIVQAHDAGEINGTHYLAMELVEGTDLAKLVKERGPLSVVQACEAIQQTALGLDAAHQGGLFHRDIKPSNLLLAKSGQIKILDLGLARLADDTQPVAAELTSTGQVLGTPDYMAPEQWDDTHTADARTDLYALGCTLYFLLVGRPPYGTQEFRSVMKKMSAHTNAPIPDLKAARPDVPDGVNAIYQRLMAKQPADRYASAAELVAVLQPFASLQASGMTSHSDRRIHDTQAGGSSSCQDVPSIDLAPGSIALQPTITFLADGNHSLAPPARVSRHQLWLSRPSTTRKRVVAVGLVTCVVLAILVSRVGRGSRPKDSEIHLESEILKSDISNAIAEINFAAERQAAERLLRLNKGKVTLEDGMTTWVMQSPLPQEPFHVRDVGFVETDLTDEEIEVLAGCRGILKLDARANARLTAAGLKKVGRLPRLQTLMLDETGCARESLEFLSNYPRLETLSISGDSRVGIMQTLPPCPRLTSLTTPYRRGNVGDEGLLTIVRNCPQLKELFLNDDEELSLVPLSQLRSLQKLHCLGSHLNDAAIVALAELPGLESLGIEVPNRKCMQRLDKIGQKLREFAMRNQLGISPESLSDAADWLPVTRFANLEQLMILELIAVDAAALQAVAAMPRLRSFSVHDNFSAEVRAKLRRYTAADIAAFRKARPDVELHIDGRDYPGN